MPITRDEFNHTWLFKLPKPLRQIVAKVFRWKISKSVKQEAKDAI